jgi:hypothetical protein
VRGPIFALPIIAALTIVGCRAVHEPPEGFRGLAWGAPVPAGWTFAGNEDELFGGMDTYVNPKEDTTFGDAKLETIRYYFWQNRLLNVVLKFNGYPNQEKVLRECEKQFGRSPRHRWAGTRAIITFQYSEKEQEGRLDMMSTVVLEAARAFEMAHLKKHPRTAR